MHESLLLTIKIDRLLHYLIKGNDKEKLVSKVKISNKL